LNFHPVAALVLPQGQAGGKNEKVWTTQLERLGVKRSMKIIRNWLMQYILHKEIALQNALDRSK